MMLSAASGDVRRAETRSGRRARGRAHPEVLAGRVLQLCGSTACGRKRGGPDWGSRPGPSWWSWWVGDGRCRPLHEAGWTLSGRAGARRAAEEGRCGGCGWGRLDDAAGRLDGGVSLLAEGWVELRRHRRAGSVDGCSAGPAAGRPPAAARRHGRPPPAPAGARGPRPGLATRAGQVSGHVEVDRHASMATGGPAGQGPGPPSGVQGRPSAWSARCASSRATLGYRGTPSAAARAARSPAPASARSASPRRQGQPCADERAELQPPAEDQVAEQQRPACASRPPRRGVAGIQALLGQVLEGAMVTSRCPARPTSSAS